MCIRDSYWIDGKEFSVETNKEIILSAGTIGSPHILQASGIGPGELLKENNINVLKDHQGVGRNLTDFKKRLSALLESLFFINFKSLMILYSQQEVRT